MKTRFLIMLALLAGLHASSQRLYFSPVRDTANMVSDSAMTGLAANLTRIYKAGSDRKAYLRTMLLLQMTSNNYAAAVQSLDSLRIFSRGTGTKFPELLFLQFELFSKAKLMESSGQLSFQQAFTQYFTRAHDALDDKRAVYISTAFVTRNGVGALQRSLERLLAGQKGKDSISLNDAVALCESYILWRVFKIIEPLAIPLLTQEDKKRFIITDSICIQTRDGACISAMVVRRRKDSRQSAVLQFTIYARAGDFYRVKDAAANGYTGVIAYTRGKMYSQEEIIPYEHDGRDVYDVIDWIVRQPWSNGKVAMFGGSYNGFTQWAATKNLHPALKTIVPSAAVAPGLDVPMTNNVFMSFTFPWIYYVTNNKFLDEDDYNNPRWDSVNTAWYASGKPYRKLDSILGRGTNKIFQRWLDHPAYDKYWQDMIPYKQEFAKIKIPVLSTTGYYDGGQIGAMYYFREHYKYNKKARHYLLIGPYGHFGSQWSPEPVYNGYEIDAVANIFMHDIIYQWFDYILKDSARPSVLQEKVNYEVMGENKWEHSPSLDKMSNAVITYYPVSAAPGANHTLQEEKPAKEEFIEQKIDFADRNTTNSYYHAARIIYDTLDTGNGIAFVSAPFRKETVISGSFSGMLKVTINKKDVDISVTLYELMPDGKYFYLSYFMGRASYSKDKSRRYLLKPGTPQNIAFTNTYITSRKISKGSKIVIVLNVNKSPDEQINYGTGKDVSEESIEDAKVPLTIRWHTGSYIKIPVKE